MSQVVDSHGDIETAAAQVYGTDVSPENEFSSEKQACDHDIVENVRIVVALVVVLPEDNRWIIHGLIFALTLDFLFGFCPRFAKFECHLFSNL